MHYTLLQSGNRIAEFQGRDVAFICLRAMREMYPNNHPYCIRFTVIETMTGKEIEL